MFQEGIKVYKEINLKESYFKTKLMFQEGIKIWTEITLQESNCKT